MASYENMVQVQISLQTSPISQAGFGTPMFIGAHAWFKDRVRIYGSVEQAADDFPTTSDEYKALQSAFEQDPKPSVVKIGRRAVDLVTLTPDEGTSAGQLYVVEVEGTDSVKVRAEHVTSGADSAETIATALVSGLSGVVGVTVADTTGALTLAKSTADEFAVTDVSGDRIVTTVATTESAATVLQELMETDDDFYFVTAHDHSEAFVLAMADAVEATKKQYFTCSQNVESLSAYVNPAVSDDVLGKLFEGNYLRSSGWFHQNADTEFPELGYVAVGSVYDAGKGIWANNKVEGQTTAADPVSGKLLTTTMKNSLTSRNASFTEKTGGLNVTSSQSGKVAGTEWIDVVRNRDFLEARITEAYQSFFINQPVVPYTDAGITRVKGVLQSELDRYIETETQPHILEKSKPYEIRFISAADSSFNDKANRVYKGEFTAYLAGAIQIFKLDGVLTYSTGA